MDIRPYRRLAMPYGLPRFPDLLAVSDSISSMYEHVGVAVFDLHMLSFTAAPVLRRMCDSLGIKFMIDCPDATLALSSAEGRPDFMTTPVWSVNSVFSACSSLCKSILVSVSSEAHIDLVKVSPAHGVFCDSSLVPAARRLLGDDHVVFSSGGDVVQAVKDGANFAVVGDSVLLAERPDKAARTLAESFRSFT